MALELPQGFPEKYPDALKYQTARAAFLALLQQLPNIKRVWMPHYICDSMLAPVKAAGKELVFYHINEQFSISNSIPLAGNDLLLYVNYFGVCDENVVEVLTQYPPPQVVIDCSQAFYSGPFECLATIYSPRKFFGVPDGGLMYSNLKIDYPLERDDDSISRMEHLVLRLALSAKAGYQSYQRAEADLAKFPPKIMSSLTQKLLRSIDYEDAQARRLANFLNLHDALGKENTLNINANSAGPLCYPFLSYKKNNKRALVEKGIFTPTYWPDAASRGELNGFESDLVNNLIAVPSNQTLDGTDLSIEIIEIKS